MSELHLDALATLRSWEPPDAGQEVLRDRYVAHLEAHPDGLDRACRPDHLTASTLVLSHDRTHVLLTLHAKARQWFQLGGHCEPGDPTLAGAALREAREESGLSDLTLLPAPVHLDEHEVPFCGPDAGDGLVVHHLDVRFAALAPRGADHAVSEESLDVRWWPVDALPLAGAGATRRRDPRPVGVEELALASVTRPRKRRIASSREAVGLTGSRDGRDRPPRPPPGHTVVEEVALATVSKPPSRKACLAKPWTSPGFETLPSGSSSTTTGRVSRRP